jgi:3-hydroxymyristoyl/3-hydroxydecanoyl-(acyl carrier protein) dehydratase
MRPVGSFAVAPDHPCLDGHFPGDPLVPGVVLLDHALALMGLPGAVALDGVKFLAPVRPDQTVAVAVRSTPAGRLAFACRVGAQPVLTGTAAAPTPLAS